MRCWLLCATRFCFAKMLLTVVLLGVCCYQPATAAEWVRKSDMPTARATSAACVLDGRIYVIGGRFFGGWPVANVEAYDPATDTWEVRADMPTRRSNLAACALDGKIYAIGGFQRDNPMAAVEIYDPVTDSWAAGSDMPTPRGSLAVAVLNGRIYAIGGWGGWANDRQFGHVEAYDPARDQWVEKAELREPRTDPAATVIDGEILAIGGYVGLKSVESVERYEPVADRWSMAGRLPFDGRVFSGGDVAVQQEMAYPAVVGGDLLACNLFSGRCTRIGIHPIGRCCYVAVIAAGVLYHIGGEEGVEAVRTVEAFDLGIGSYSIEPGAKLGAL